MTSKDFQEEVCGCCGQTKEYIYGISRGVVDILKAFSNYIEQKESNIVHIEKEMVGKWITGNQYANVKILTAHGLLAKDREEVGNYHMTTKGLDFLKGESICKYAIISKVEKRQIGYWREEVKCCVDDFSKGTYWQGINYEIREGRIIGNQYGINR